MATSDKPRSPESNSADLLAVIRASGVLTDRQFEDVKSKVLSGKYPIGSQELAERLVREKVLTEYQTKRFLNNKSHGMVVGRYAILDRIGSGSMGRVYKAQHLMMDRVVALKIIAPEIANNDRVVARFHREMKLVGRLDHPNVVRAFDADQMNKVLYIVMEFVSGLSLSQRYRQGLIPPQDMVNYAAQAALGLSHAHSQGIVHRDIKPSNLLLTEDHKLKVLDLGLGVLMEADEQSSFATADGVAVGTIDYMSPEQACGRDVDGRSDLFSLGCSMYHMMSGRLPFPGDSPVERLGKRISGRPEPLSDVMPGVPAALCQVMDRLLATKPADRFQSAEEAADALQALLKPKSKRTAAPAPEKAEPESPSTPPPPPPKPVVITKRPEYPGWFRPIADLAERKPRTALLATLGALSLAFGSGLGLGYLLLR
ncbi:serine/threonine-protein kinase [Singulisphaera sp. PoT]|uniref:serine/threonine-protein kinase n=1 Tax=Singulisphaera sp. PoT TaxID=3411797 RepID=UPI003BF58001